MLHTHWYIYHQRCIMFLSQYFSFPCQYHSTNAPYSFIHLPPTLYNVSLPVLLFSLSVSFHQCFILIFIYTLLLTGGQTGEAWEPSKNKDLSKIEQHWIEKYFHILPYISGPRCCDYGYYCFLEYDAV
jgi:hypothetical protein